MLQGLASAMRAYGCQDRFIDSFIMCMRFRRSPEPMSHQRMCYYGEKLLSGEKVKTVVDGFVVTGTVVEPWRVANVLKLEKSGEVKWVLGEADLSLG